MRRAAWALAALLASCGGEAGPRWIELARAEVRGQLPAGEVALPDGGRARYETVEGELWLVTELAGAAFTARGEGRWTASLPVVALGHSSVARAPYRVRAGERRLTYEADPARFGQTPGTFTTCSRSNSCWRPANPCRRRSSSRP